MKLRSHLAFVCFSSALVLAAAEPVAAPPVQPVVVLVHGAWGGGWQFKKVAPLLAARGYTVYRPTLTGLGERVHLATADTGLATHIDDIVNLIVFENLHDVILVGHSYGGMVITGVADRIPERIARLVYLDAMLPVDGESAASLGKAGMAALLQRAKDGFIAPWWVRPDKPFPRDVPHPVKTFTDDIALKNPAAAKIPGVYILTVDQGRRPEDDDFYSASIRATARGWPRLVMEADHNPEWFKPAETVEFLVHALAPEPVSGK